MVARDGIEPPPPAFSGLASPACIYLVLRELTPFLASKKAELLEWNWNETEWSAEIRTQWNTVRKRVRDCEKSERSEKGGASHDGMERAVVRCGACNLNQYVPRDGCCRRSAAPLNQITKSEAGISASELFASHKTDVLSSSLVSERNYRSMWTTALAPVPL